MREGCAIVIGSIALLIILYLVGGWLVSVAWNIVIPHAFGLPQIDWVQGIALAYLMGQLAGFTGKTHNAAMNGVK